MSALLGPAEIRSLAAELGTRPTKALGQNFLHDANTIRRIVRTAELAPGESVLEVGPGLGSLTLGLLEEGHPVTAIEIDPVLAGALPRTVQTRLPGAPLTVIRADALAVVSTSSTAEAPTALVANLPYNVAVPVLLHLLATFESLRMALVLVQAEVADRLAAPPGGKVYGVPSAKTAWYGEVSKAGNVGPNVFWPVPNVDSGLVRLVRRDPPATTATREEVFTVIDAAFAQRRKMLRSALATWAGGNTEAERILRAAGIDPTARGETLDVTNFARIAAAKVATERDPTTGLRRGT
ncbi:MAG TPA: 16S rRNA (adenine(1518)-N(6)/adenine(1519)-N(6))-dimethyltransferase RsmA [Jatrophihabitans sp.]